MKTMTRSVFIVDGHCGVSEAEALGICNVVRTSRPTMYRNCGFPPVQVTPVA